MQDGSLSCPFCCYESFDQLELQNHVTTAHEEELRSPTKDVLKKTNSINGSQDDISECPMCNKTFPFGAIEKHVSTHFITCEEEAGCSSSSDAMLAMEMQLGECGNDDALAQKQAEDVQLKMLQQEFNLDPDDKVNYKKQAASAMKKAVGRRKITPSEYYQKKFEMLESLERGVDDGSTVTRDFALKLCKLGNQLSQGVHWILTSTAVHYGRGPGDSGWGCGFRNLQMMLASLVTLPEYKAHLKQFQDDIPSIPKLQQLIEDAWKCGFDPNGKEQLMGKLFGTRKWIGATEAFVLLSSLHMHCKIIDFEARSKEKINRKLFDWISDYFKAAKCSQVTPGSTKLVDTPLLYLQHHGHSRSVCGVQFNINSNTVTHLLICDPGTTKSQLSTDLSRSKKASFAKTINSFKEEKYQVVAVVGIASKEQFEKQKNVDSMAEKIYS